MGRLQRHELADHHRGRGDAEEDEDPRQGLHEAHIKPDKVGQGNAKPRYDK